MHQRSTGSIKEKHMKYQTKNNHIIMKDIEHFDVHQIFKCGQNFRFEQTAENTYTGIAFGKILKLEQNNDTVILYDTTLDDFENIWKSFLALDEDYNAIKKAINSDMHMDLALQYGWGIRILKQDFWEMLISFILSQNNNIPRIKKIIDALCKYAGNPIDKDGYQTYTFPSLKDLSDVSEENLRKLGMGYRAAYIKDAVEKFSSGELDLKAIQELETLDAKKQLMKIKGVGEKVADCILLFGMSRYDVCPQDVWVKRIFTEIYQIKDLTVKKGYAFADQKWGKYSGLAQQYLFYCARENTDQNPSTKKSSSLKENP